MTGTQHSYLLNFLFATHFSKTSCSWPATSDDVTVTSLPAWSSATSEVDNSKVWLWGPGGVLLVGDISNVKIYKQMNVKYAIPTELLLKVYFCISLPFSMHSNISTCIERNYDMEAFGELYRAM